MYTLMFVLFVLVYLLPAVLSLFFHDSFIPLCTSFPNKIDTWTKAARAIKEVKMVIKEIEYGTTKEIS